MYKQVKCRYCDFTIDISDDMSEKAKDGEFRHLLGHCYSAHRAEMAKNRKILPPRSAAFNRQLDRKVIVDEMGFDQFDKLVPLDRLFKS